MTRWLQSIWAGAIVTVLLVSCSSSSTTETLSAPCAIDDAMDLLSYCHESWLFDPVTSCGESNNQISPPEDVMQDGALTGEFLSRCANHNAGPLLACHARVCRELQERYNQLGTTDRVAISSRFLDERYRWCEAEDVSKALDDSCEQSCYEKTGYPDWPLRQCVVSSWDECTACEQREYAEYQKCASGCAVTACSNGVRDGNETDVDCGGICRPCLDEKACETGADCQSNHCEAGLCVTATCDDGIRNQFETDVDCGAWCERPCLTGERCIAPMDCESKACKRSGSSFDGTCE